MLKFFRRENLRTESPFIDSSNYKAILQAADIGQLWGPRGHFYPDCSAEASKSGDTFASGFW